MADGGTIFLDEIGELDPPSQVKLLRVLQDRTFEVLGSSRARTVDVRVVAATNRALHELVQRGEFREDLLYRLNLINIHLPPLRDRRGDIPRLANHFLRLANEAYRADVESISARAMEWLQARRTWPGNIRQLRQTIDRAVLIRGGRELDVDDFFAVRDAVAAAPREETLPDAGTMTLDEMEKRMIVKCMKHYEGNVSRVAEALGLSRAALYRRMEKYGIGVRVASRSRRASPRSRLDDSTTRLAPRSSYVVALHASGGGGVHSHRAPAAAVRGRGAVRRLGRHQRPPGARRCSCRSI